MRAILKALFIVALVATPSITLAQQAELRLGEQVVFSRDENGERVRIPQTTIDAWAYIVGGLGTWGFCYGEKSYGSCTAGLFFDFTDWFEVGVAGGAERFRGDDELFRTYGRYAVSVLILGESRCPLELYYENGPSREYWYQGTLTCDLSEYDAVGVISQRFVGVGPFLKLHPIQGLPVEFWGARMYDHEQLRGQRWNWTVGARIVLH